MELTGSFGWIEGDPPASGAYERLKVSRDELVVTLRTLATMAEEATKPGVWLLHSGI